jgi:hypothetical protein
MLGAPRAERALVEIGPRVPLLTPDAVLFFGQDQGHAGDPEQRVRDHLGMR